MGGQSEVDCWLSDVHISFHFKLMKSEIGFQISSLKVTFSSGWTDFMGACDYAMIGYGGYYIKTSRINVKRLKFCQGILHKKAFTKLTTIF